ncbi:hypothetical protein LWI28_009300 [Acer negundo]|uniref:Uncharacterized protein n=1 Tax=Acer negundo TaxID=4023 RepID=A0AAD5NY36_ACENE|nr:hypothetical protein LWI28_009300 [Acer negundo]
MKTSALSDSGADASLSLDSESPSYEAGVYAHSLKEAFRPEIGLFRWFGLGKSGPRLRFLGRMLTYAIYDSSDYSYANSVGDSKYSASETMFRGLASGNGRRPPTSDNQQMKDDYRLGRIPHPPGFPAPCSYASGSFYFLCLRYSSCQTSTY